MRDPLSIRTGDNEGFNIITINGTIDAASTALICDTIIKSRPGPFLVYIASGGGGVGSGQSITDMLNSYDVPVTYISRGYCASMAAIMPHLGDGLRLSFASTTFMYHHTKYNPKGTADTILEGVALMHKDDEAMNLEVRKAIGLTKREWQKYNGEDIYLNAKLCMGVGKNGMVDGIILKDYRDGRFIIQTREGKKEVDIMIHRRKDLPTLPVIE